MNLQEFKRFYGIRDLKFRLSKRKNKKYDAIIDNDIIIPFGDSRYEHYDTSNVIPQHLHKPEWHHYNGERRKRYRQRAKYISDKSGNLTYNNIYSPNFWSYHLLW